MTEDSTLHGTDSPFAVAVVVFADFDDFGNYSIGSFDDMKFFLGEWNFWGSFFIKSALSGQYWMLPEFLEYALALSNQFFLTDVNCCSKSLVEFWFFLII